MVKYAQYIIFPFMILVTAIGWLSFYHENAAVKETRILNAEEFKKMTYTDEELALFCDIAFMHEDTRVRKWNKDIKVEIRNISELSLESIDEVDSIISILAPLIAPLKIERVNKNGNLHVYRRVDKIISSKHAQVNPACINGMAKLNTQSIHSWSIDQATIYDGYHSDSQTLMHEFEHALGLAHPIKLYPYYVTIGRSVIPQYFRSLKEIQDFYREPFYISEQEKTVIKMLYSPEIRAGLHIETFAKKMEFDIDERMRLIPDIRDRQVTIYPSPPRFKRHNPT